MVRWVLQHSSLQGDVKDGIAEARTRCGTEGDHIVQLYTFVETGVD